MHCYGSREENETCRSLSNQQLSVVQFHASPISRIFNSSGTSVWGSFGPRNQSISVADAAPLPRLGSSHCRWVWNEVVTIPGPAKYRYWYLAGNGASHTGEWVGNSASRILRLGACVVQVARSWKTGNGRRSVVLVGALLWEVAVGGYIALVLLPCLDRKGDPLVREERAGLRFCLTTDIIVKNVGVGSSASSQTGLSTCPKINSSFVSP